jgi:iron donor protein CyaY
MTAPSRLSEQDFRIEADRALEHAQRALLPLADAEDFEVELQNGVLQVVFDDPPAKFVVSPNAPVRQIWVSALSRSYKLSWVPETGDFVLDGVALNALLEQLVQQHLNGSRA